MPEQVMSITLEQIEIGVILSDHVLTYLADPYSSGKAVRRELLVSKIEEALPQIFDIYKRKRAALSGVISSESTKLNIVFAYKKVGVRLHEFKVVTIEVKPIFEPASKKDVMIRVSKKSKFFKGQRAEEIGPDIYALPTSFEEADPYGLIHTPLIIGIIEKRKKLRPGFYGMLDLLDGAIRCVAEVDRAGSFLIDCAFWEPYGEFQTLKIR